MIRTMTTETATFRQRVIRGDTLLGAFLNLASPAAAELCARAGFDWLIVDLEHGAGNEADLVPVLTAIETTRTAALVRPASGERIRIGRALDLGATGIMVPRLDTVEEVRQAVSYLRYPPCAAWRS
jgi:2-keto-3-deoxy-L-rhamnonate aldolase RhmA